MDKKTLSESDKNQIKQKLDEKIKVLTCPMCGNKSFIMADGYFNQTIQPELKGIKLGGQSIPTIGIICSNCGFVSQHAIGVLGLLPQDSSESNK